MTKQQMPYGHWPSDLTSDQLASGTIRFGAARFWGNDIIWLESLPSENGRTTIMHRHNSFTEAILPAPWSVRSSAHEYGGGALAVAGDAIFFVNASDQNIYMIRKGDAPTAITQNDDCRYADLTPGQNGWLYAICETFTPSQVEPVASVVAINYSTQKIITLAEGEDFYAGLTVASNSEKLAFISWNHPDMPWDKTTLNQIEWQAGSSQDISLNVIRNHESESILQPQYSPDGGLFYVSDLDGWWNIYQADEPENSICPMPAEFATPQWTFGMQNWGFVSSETLLTSSTQNGRWSLSLIDINNGQQTAITSQLNTLSDIHCQGHQALLLGASGTSATAPYLYKDEELTALKEPVHILAKKEISLARSMAFPTGSNDEKAQLFYYPPKNSRYESPNQLPPLIVLGHGGPTGATDASLNLKIQYWTQRGFAVADVNYRGSTGFGRVYRDALRLNWGIKDVEDLCAAADFLVEKKLAHPNQKIIKGSSAGGYSVLAALTMHTTFDAGVSLYGVADLHALASDTHKFEAKYLDGLIGPYPEQKNIYTDRSPISHIEHLNCPILIAQGLEDKVVPPKQAEIIVDAAQAKGIPVVYLPFDNEGHGFRQPSTLRTLFSAELAFYQNQLLTSNSL